jgi:flagellin-like protein
MEILIYKRHNSGIRVTSSTYYTRDIQKIAMEYNHFLAIKRIIVLFESGKKEPQLIELYSVKTDTMSNTTFNRKNRTKKGISPVIATVILVAVAVVIAAALAGFSSSLFGTYSSAGAAVTVTAVSVSAATSFADVTLQNNGNTADDLVSVQVDNGAIDIANIPLPADGSQVNYVTLTDLGTFGDGDIVTVKMKLSSGGVLSQSVTVSP